MKKEVNELAERISKRLSSEFIGAKMGPGMDKYVQDAIVDEIVRFEESKKLPVRDTKKGYEL